MDSGAWQVTVCGVAESDRTDRLSKAQLGNLCGEILVFNHAIIMQCG